MIHATDASSNQSMVVLMIFKKIKETQLKFFRGNVMVLWKMVHYKDARGKLSNAELNKLKLAAENRYWY